MPPTISGGSGNDETPEGDGGGDVDGPRHRPYTSRRLAAILHPTRSRQKTLAVLVMATRELTAYFDESGAHGGPDDVLTLAGFVARENVWTRIERTWNRRLGRRIFHMSEFENRRGAFKAWPPTERARTHLIAGLADCIQGNPVSATSQTIELKPFREILCQKANPRSVKSLAYGWLVWACLKDMADSLRLPPGERVSVICEECEGVEGFALECFQVFKRRRDAKGQFGAMTFQPKDAFRGLQAADMLAYESFKHITNQIIREGSGPARKLFNALTRSNRIQMGYARAEEIRAFKARHEPFPSWPPRNR